MPCPRSRPLGPAPLPCGGVGLGGWATWQICSWGAADRCPDPARDLDPQDGSDDDEGPTKRPNLGMEAGDKSLTVRLLVSNATAGSIIGKVLARPLCRRAAGPDQSVAAKAASSARLAHPPLIAARFRRSRSRSRPRSLPRSWNRPPP